MEIKEFIIDILVKRIQNQSINPVTGEVFKLEDIKIQQYKIEVEEQLGKDKTTGDKLED